MQSTNSIFTANFDKQFAFLSGCPAHGALHKYLKQHVRMSIKKKSNTVRVREQPPRMCKKNNSKINCESVIEQHLIVNPECAKTHTDDNFRIIGQARSSFHLSVLESVYINTQNTVLCRQKEFVFLLGLFK